MMSLKYFEVSAQHAEVGQIQRCIVYAHNEEEAKEIASPQFQEQGINKKNGLYRESQFPLKVTLLDDEAQEAHLVMTIRR